MILHMVSFSNY